jgi:hypothetical protein
MGVRETSTQEATMTCQTKTRRIACSTAPEMFRTTVGDQTRIECLAHALISESKGRPVEVIRR